MTGDKWGMKGACKGRKVMSKLKERDEQEALKLDENFKEILSRVRPYIVNLTSKEDAQFCKVWLEKLSTISTQRKLRNEYLLELYRQLSLGRIESTFRKPPPGGILIPLPVSYQVENISSSCTEVTDWGSTSCSMVKKPNARNDFRKYSKSKASLRRRDTDSTDPSFSFIEDDKLDKSQLQLYRQRIEALTVIVKELQIQNERLNKEILQCQEKCSVETPCLKANIRQLNSEIAILKAKLVEVQQMKEVLEVNHKEIVQQYKITMTDQFNKLKARLQEAQSKNIVLDDNILSITQKLEEVTREKDEKVKMVEKEWSKKYEDTHKDYESLLQNKEKELQIKNEVISQKEAELAQKDHVKREEMVSLINQIKELEIKLEAKIEDEEKLQDMLVKQCALMKEEFAKMRDDIEFASQKQNEGLINKVEALKKNVLKLEKSKAKLAYDYEKRISQILKSKELELKTLQFQLQGHRSELSISLSAEKQNEWDSLVNMLEERYKALLTAVDVSADNQRQNYIRVQRIVQLLSKV
ncbi:protein Hook homolog 3-like isoform X2 [Belonocnema kinseyi]|uniref:protein Hook homolog 3-like isoform X2 n=1 Tax=Belonocnema kinseyi TaxID=2817044 RepID=UPI00143DAE03|nr:protein Hook homolog 3-like isoform X2 [Belonocnema kinseyi]